MVAGRVIRGGSGRRVSVKAAEEGLAHARRRVVADFGCPACGVAAGRPCRGLPNARAELVAHPERTRYWLARRR